MSPFCERCGCEDESYFVSFQGKDQCRRCIGYQGQEGKSLDVSFDVDEVLPFNLSPIQKEISHQIYLHSLKKDVLVHAVCGAGKTELILETITQYLSQHKRVGIAIARRQVVLELAKRYQAIFPSLKVGAVCEGYTTDLEAHLVVCTTHQLYRFHKAFDLLVLDEPDAFPFSNDDVLQGFARQAVKEVTVLLTATPDAHQLKRVQDGTLAKVVLNRRPHGYDLANPKLMRMPLPLQIAHLFYYLSHQRKSTLIFVPTKRLGKMLSVLMRLPFAYAHKEGLDELLQAFKDKAFPHLLCTTVLERGLTFADVQVVILMAQHPVFNEASLIQIAGRVGRVLAFPEGEVIFYCEHKTEAIQACMKMIQSANAA